MSRTELIVVASATCVLVLGALKNVDLRGTLSTLCNALSDDLAIESDLAVDAFTKTECGLVPLTPGHTHPTAAANRTAARDMADTIARRAGSRLHILQMSKSDQRKGYNGTRQWYWAKDTKVSPRNDVIFPDDIMFICDVDYYINMKALLTRHVRPVLLYTVVPETASSNGEDDTSFCFKPDGSLKTSVRGGGSYEHFLWNYGHDSVKVVKRFFGIPTRVTTYAIERTQISRHRQLILMTPLQSFSGLCATIANWLISPAELERFNPIVVGKDGVRFVRFNVNLGGKINITTGRPNTYLCATVPADVDASIAEVAKLGSSDLMMPTTASWLPKEQRSAATILTSYYRANCNATVPFVFPVSKAVRAYQYEPRTYNQEAKPKLEAFMSPLINGAFAPVADAASERRCVEGRIDGLKKPEPRPNSFRDRCIGEFAELVVNGAILIPYCYEYIEKKQDSASQKLSLRKAVVHGPFKKAVLKCFIKSEAYQDIKDPRNISTYNDSDKLSLSGFALALSEHCKQFAWYGPGKKPREIANRVVAICQDADFVNISDYHRMDGTISYKLREVEQAVFMKAFKHHRTELNELLKNNSGNYGILPQGTTFEQGSSHGSGSADTSLAQTLRAAFAAYLGFRNVVTPEGSRYSPSEAFSRLGIHLGDDGVDADLPIENHDWAAVRVGLVLEAAVIPRGARGVNFLARYYSPEVWYGCPDSMCDVRRQLSKFHTTVRLPANVKHEDKLVEKARSFVATDANTPVLGQLCQQVLVFAPVERTPHLGIHTWWSKFEQSDQFPNRNVGGWMDVEFDFLLPEFDRHLFNKWVVGTKSLTEILKAPLCMSFVPATPAVVDVVVDDSILDAQKKAENKKPSKKSSPSLQNDESRSRVKEQRLPRASRRKSRSPVKTKKIYVVKSSPKQKSDTKS